MDADIKVFIGSIKEKTGIAFSVYKPNGEFVGGNGTIYKNIPKSVHGIVVDIEDNRTLFPISYKNKNFIGCLDGANIEQKNYAYLISELAENSFFKESGLSKADFFKAILFGDANHSQISRYMKKYAIKDVPSFVLLVGVDSEHANEIKEVLSTCAEDNDLAIKIDEEQLAFVKFLKKENGDYQSPTEFAEFLKQSIYEEIGVKVKIAIGGTVRAISDLSTSFSQAISAYRMYSIINPKGDIHSYKDYLLIKMLEDLPKYKLNENLELLMDSGAKEIFNDEEMLNTAEEFLESSLNTSETSRKLYLHRNTLIYRLDKIEKATGLNIRKFSDAITFRLITILSRLVK